MLRNARDLIEIMRSVPILDEQIRLAAKANWTSTKVTALELLLAYSQPTLISSSVKVW